MNKLLFLVFFFSFLQLAATTVSNNYDLTNPLPTYLASSNSYPNINNNLKINHKKTNFTIQAQNETHGGYIGMMSSLYF
ncbi:hypothetical protein FM755_08140 [Francisella tularensis]|uniref:Uncharacterized protein n=9 Tax=Francisella tularensis TaxID=263 RepID=A0AAI8BGX8_FRATH|nr:hypothetical protein [Francisella tularensis]AFX71253.1 hypothetical protein F92_09085 [Francisella tularensis subsp. holarctica F92]AHH46909.1 hypothetical protein X557_08440 [Francisella tularensis subsp. holarctica PHIT-FT049]EBA53086.1 hypothetical protein FTHG_01528 [Francisella tularensis subsp. holarctica 257]ABI83372.1 hypothetical protein FTH_1583 [Francisella tularensis subsp. holarctica OSU18]ABU62209.1 hypothetical protein FTA_1734 [Francisella tularensis subsp. holarctica FTNF0